MPAATKATYSLDAASLTRLKRLAQRWQVSKTEVIRRALAQVDEPELPSVEERIAALRELQRLTKARGIDLKKWQETIRNGRR